MFSSRSRYEVDHAVPLFMGGRNDVSNLQALCVQCHAEKTDTDMSFPLK